MPFRRRRIGWQYSDRGDSDDTGGAGRFDRHRYEIAGGSLRHDGRVAEEIRGAARGCCCGFSAGGNGTTELKFNRRGYDMSKRSSPTYSTLLCALASSVRTITLNRPERRNAINGELIQDLLSALADAETDAAVRVVILTGTGKAFCSGMDLETLQSVAAQTPEENLGDSRQMARLFQRVYTFFHRVI